MKTLYVPTPRRLDIYRDTDYRYSFQLLRLSEYQPRLQMTTSNSLAFDFRYYSRLALARGRQNLRLPIPRRWTLVLSQYYKMPSSDPFACGADAILAYERYPINAPLPVIWITGTTNVNELRKKGVTERDIQDQIEFKREANAAAAATVLATNSKKKLFDEVIRPTKPTQVIPFFQPILPILPEQFEAKWRDLSAIKLLFIGRAARRKGLPLVLEAYAMLQARFPGKLSLHVVSSLADGPLKIPALPGLVYEPAVAHARAIQLMTESHFLLMPSELEEYGWVYVESMARGTIPLAADSPVQRELLDNGNSGILIERTSEALAGALTTMLEEDGRAWRMACHALLTWRTRFAPDVIADQFAALVEGSLSSPARSATEAPRADFLQETASMGAEFR